MSANSTITTPVTIVGMGYVGLTLAATLADLEFQVRGYDIQSNVIGQLNQGRSHILEPGVEDVLKAHAGKNLTFTDALPEVLSGIVIVCVSTPVTEELAPNLDNLKSAIEAIAKCVQPETLVIIRSTVPVGTCRDLVLPILQASCPSVRLASCPERTIQGKALSELRNLPQVVSGLDEASIGTATEFWQRVTHRVVPMSSLEAAEMVKLINNCHTDLIYSYGNEVALMAQRLNLDPTELIQAANLDYPRPDLARPGFVAGPCMSKDPYLLLSSLAHTGYEPQLVAGARSLNRGLPAVVAQHFVDGIRESSGRISNTKVLVCGFAYKGWPITDDTRDSPAIPIVAALNNLGLDVFGHDFVVTDDKIASFGAKAVSGLEEGFKGAGGVLFVNEHPGYRDLDIGNLSETMNLPGVVYDCWRVLNPESVTATPGVRYMSIGYG